MREETGKDQDTTSQVGDDEIIILPGGRVILPRSPEFAPLARSLGDERAMAECESSECKVIFGSRKCG